MDKIAIIGLGYVGLPLAVEFGKKLEVIGFDINASRISELNLGIDHTLEVSTSELKEANNLTFTISNDLIKDCNIFIITVPTPIDDLKRPDLNPLRQSSKLVGSLLKNDDIVIYESTVYPGATEEVCVPILEESSNLKLNKDFYCGYSPERINPGDKVHRLPDIVKVTSGSTPEIADRIDKLYRQIITAGTHQASSIKVAEAAKVIENTQRDVNIALINELSLIFDRLNIDTEDVLNAAGSKWNFLPFRPGLVGGHCIGVDPYYLTYKSIEVGYHPEMILAGRRLNDNMSHHIAAQVLSLMTKKNIKSNQAKILIMGLTFKENCPDLRNTRVMDLIAEFKSFHCIVDVFDPWVTEYNQSEPIKFNIVEKPKKGEYDVIVISVAHDIFRRIGIEKIKSFGRKNHVLFDIKHILDKNQVDGRL